MTRFHFPPNITLIFYISDLPERQLQIYQDEYLIFPVFSRPAHPESKRISCVCRDRGSQDYYYRQGGKGKQAGQAIKEARQAGVVCEGWNSPYVCASRARETENGDNQTNLKTCGSPQDTDPNVSFRLLLVVGGGEREGGDTPV